MTTKEYYAEHRQEMRAQQKQARLKTHEYHRRTRTTRAHVCTRCGKTLTYAKTGRYTEHFCSPNCYLRSFDQYRK